jgi:coenzyme F420-reducing hydrogenase delta subunit
LLRGRANESVALSDVDAHEGAAGVMVTGVHGDDCEVGDVHVHAGSAIGRCGLE